MVKETVKVMVNGVEDITTIEFTLEKTQIMIASVGTEISWQESGYGRLAFDGLKLISEQYKLPIIVWSLATAVEFYEKVGFLHLSKPEVQKKVKFGNIPKSEIKIRINDYDLVYLPKSLTKIPTIFT